MTAFWLILGAVGMLSAGAAAGYVLGYAQGWDDGQDSVRSAD